MKRVILWIVAVLITFAIGVVTDRIAQHFSTGELPAAVPLQPVAFNFPDPKPEFVPAVADASTAAATPKPILIRDYDPEKFFPWGVFHVMGPVPKEFAEVDSIEVGIYGHGDSDPGYIALHTNMHNEYESGAAVFAFVTTRRLFFVTEQLPDLEFEYRFDGEFLHTDFERFSEKNKAVLRGTLTKTKNGRTIAQCKVSFRFEHLGC